MGWWRSLWGIAGMRHQTKISSAKRWVWALPCKTCKKTTNCYFQMCEACARNTVRGEINSRTRSWSPGNTKSIKSDKRWSEAVCYCLMLRLWEQGWHLQGSDRYSVKRSQRSLMGSNSTVKTAVQMNIAASERKWEGPNTLWIHCNKNRSKNMPRFTGRVVAITLPCLNLCGKVKQLWKWHVNDGCPYFQAPPVRIYTSMETCQQQKTSA